MSLKNMHMSRLTKKTINQKLTYVSIVTRTFKNYYCVSMPTFLAIVNIAIIGNMIFFGGEKNLLSLLCSILSDRYRYDFKVHFEINF